MLNHSYLLKDLDILKQHLAKFYSMVQIEKDANGEERWTDQSDPDTVGLFGHKHLPSTSPKGFLFAEKEALYKFDGETFESITPQVVPKVLFGVQACDLTAIAYQDKFFKQDPYYQKRRENILLVGIDCESPCTNGFCAEVKAGPHVNDNTADLVVSRLTVNGSNQLAEWLVIAETEKGQNSIKGLPLDKAHKAHFILRNRLLDKMRSEFADYSYINNAIEYLNDNAVPQHLWEEMSVRCLSCSGCTNLCPTCSCYSTYEIAEKQPDNVISETKAVKTETLRVWDSCLFEGFQREASGHNPAQQAAQRVERFWFHKFSDEYLTEFQRYGCVGCGRCEQTCPGTIGVHSVMKRINQECCS
ncbi:4Fe-4S dicluster domain-containing protein [uncultured Paraglaciecola sp.]|mgnify:FL=1|jgi:sulfhydrogenase subunit beta (sulfur reductase)|uniref:4Fe-4S dicluster domain-containing protein n=1 Tax=uncultured Paraglaciecola sp. TaxID=1765024 RepID=UPI0025FB1E26|nr:4Fe-4S dicluster domain-containing protein [uncultured Paraglaciecola sp.]